MEPLSSQDSSLLNLQTLKIAVSIDDLPPEILLHILGYVAGRNAYSSKDLILQTCLVSQKWRDLSQQVLYRDVAVFGIDRPYMDYGDPESHQIAMEQYPEVSLISFKDLEDLAERGFPNEDADDCDDYYFEGINDQDLGKRKDARSLLVRTLLSRPDLGRAVQTVSLLYSRSGGQWEDCSMSLCELLPNLTELRSCADTFRISEIGELPFVQKLVLEECTLIFPNRGKRCHTSKSLQSLKVLESRTDMIHKLPSIFQLVQVGQLQELSITRRRHLHSAQGGSLAQILRPHMFALNCFEYFIDDAEELEPDLQELTDIIDLLPLATVLTKLTIGIDHPGFHLSNLIHNTPPSLKFLDIEFINQTEDEDHLLRVSPTRTFADALLDRLVKEGEKGLPQLVSLRLRLFSALDEDDDWVDEGDSDYMEDQKAKWGMIEHCAPLMDELERRKIRYSSRLG